jgi:hypothetical protein
VASNNTHLDLFAPGTNGAVFSTFWETTGGWQPWFQIRPASRGRTHGCATLLPTGDVLLTGGAAPDNDQAGVMEPEIYDAPIDRRQAVTWRAPEYGRQSPIRIKFCAIIIPLLCLCQTVESGQLAATPLANRTNHRRPFRSRSRSTNPLIRRDLGQDQ